MKKKINSKLQVKHYDRNKEGREIEGSEEQNYLEGICEEEKETLRGEYE